MMKLDLHVELEDGPAHRPEKADPARCCSSQSETLNEEEEEADGFLCGQLHAVGDHSLESFGGEEEREEEGEEAKWEALYDSEKGSPCSETDFCDQEWENMTWRYWLELPKRSSKRGVSWSVDSEVDPDKVELDNARRRKSTSACEEYRELCSLERIESARERVQHAAHKLVDAQLRLQEIQLLHTEQEKEEIEAPSKAGSGSRSGVVHWLAARLKGSRSDKD